MGSIKRHDWDWKGAEAALKRAVELNPNSSRAHHAYAGFLRVQRRFDEALSELRKAQVLDPLSLSINRDIGSTFLFKKKYDEAINQLETLLTMYPNYGRYWLVRAYWVKGEHEEAIAQAAESEALFLGHLLSGNREEAIRTLENWTGQTPQSRMARYAIAGEKDRAIELLENALDEGYPGVVYANAWPEFDPLRDDPRFHDLLRRMNLEP
jgi:tetratricopeptide (TPR) repeat protein